jgi:hypothetical protein
VYVPDPENFLPDFLSRSFEPEVELNHIELKSSIDWIVEQANDEEINRIIKLIQSNADDTEWFKVKNGSRWKSEKRELYLSEGVLKHSNDKIVCPQHLKINIF